MKTLKHFLLTSAIYVFLVACSNSQQPASQDPTTSLPVTVADVHSSSIQEVLTTTGTAHAMKQIELKSEIAGVYYLMKNPATGKVYKMGDYVKEGSVLVKLENEEYVNSIRLASKELQVEISKNEWEAQQRIYDKGGITYKDKINAENAYNEAKYALEDAGLQMQKIQIKAPFSGIITALPYYTPGTKIDPSSIATLMQYDQMFMEVQFSEKNIASIALKQPVNITCYTLQHDTLRGYVEQLSPVVNEQTRTFAGRIRIENPERSLRPGMFVKADIITAQSDSSIVLPKKLIQHEHGRSYVFVFERQRAVRKRVTLGIETDFDCEVLEGLTLGERLITSGNDALSDGSRVSIRK